MAQEACDKKRLQKELDAGIDAARADIEAAVGPEEAEKIIKKLKEGKDEAVETSTRPLPDIVYRIAVIALGAAMLLAALGYILIATVWGTAADTPDGLVAIGSGAVGALAGLLAPTQIQR